MARRTMQVTLEIVVSDLPDNGRMEALSFEDDRSLGIPRLDEYQDPDELAGLLQEGINPGTCTEMFAGTGIFVQFESALLIGADWITPITGTLPTTALPTEAA